MAAPPDPPADALIRRLDTAARLPDADRHAIQGIPLTVRALAANQDIAPEGDASGHCCLVLAGWVCGYQTLAEGRRQIVSIHLPGELTDLHGLHLPGPDYGLSALTAASVALVPHVQLRRLAADRPAVAAALWREALVAAAIQRTWLTGLGRRDGRGRLAHLFCELYLRLSASGSAADHGMLLPIRQHDLADVLGQTSVHINRMLRELRDEGMLALRDRRLEILDWPGLVAMAEFDPRYLHLGVPV